MFSDFLLGSDGSGPPCNKGGPRPFPIEAAAAPLVWAGRGEPAENWASTGLAMDVGLSSPTAGARGQCRAVPARSGSSMASGAHEPRSVRHGTLAALVLLSALKGADMQLLPSSRLDST